MALADIAFMRALAHARDCARPAGDDGADAERRGERLCAGGGDGGDPGACYLRAVRADLPILYGESEAFPFGGYKVLRAPGQGAGPVVLAAAGYLVHSCLEGGRRLRGGIGAAVVDAYALPIDSGAGAGLARRAGRHPGRRGQLCRRGRQRARRSGGGGQDGAAGAVAGGGQFPKSGRTADDVLGYVRLAVSDIVEAARALAG